MKKQMKKLIAAVSAAVLCAVPLVNVATPASAYDASQKLTYRVYEKVNAKSMKDYSSTVKAPSTCTYGQTVFTGNGYGYQSSILNSKTNTLTNEFGISSYHSGLYVCESTWYAPVSLSNFSVEYNYKTTGSATITLISGVLVGDIDQDGDVDRIDAEKILNYSSSVSAGIRPTGYSEKALLAADVDNDGKISINDANLVLRFAEGENILFS